MFSPVSAGAELPSANSKFSVADGVAVSLPTGSTCQRKFWFTAALLLLLKADPVKLMGWEFAPLAAVAVPAVGKLNKPPTVAPPFTSRVLTGAVVLMPILAVFPVPI